MAILQPSLTGRNEDGAIELEDIQHFLMSRPRPRAARYDFLTFRSGYISRGVPSRNGCASGNSRNYGREKGKQP